MKELLYFFFADLMACIECCPAAGTLRYATHRKMSRIERSVVEQYLSTDFTKKSNPPARRPISVVYRGTDTRLIRSLHAFHSKNDRHELARKEVSDSVNELISRSMQKYYFEQIGDTILAARRDAANLETRFVSEPTRRKLKLEELVSAYNAHADQKITLDEVVPIELKSCFGIPATASYVRAERTTPVGRSIELAE